MNRLKPVSITRPEPNILKFEWNDGYSATIRLEDFRKECPCATCQGEHPGENKVQPVFPIFKPGMNELIELNPVGNYAVQARWGDGHNTGIYPWDYIREIFEKHSKKNL